MIAQPQTYILLLILALFGVAYAGIVRRIRQRDPAHGHTAWLVVVGDLAIVVGFTILAGLEAGALLFLCMAAAGVPMVVEFGDWHLGQIEQQRRQQSLSDLLRDEEEPVP